MEPWWLWLLPLAFGVGGLLLVSFIDALWRMHRVLAEVAAALIIASLPFLCMLPFKPWAVVAYVVVYAWLLLLPARLIFGRLDKAFLRSSTVLNIGLSLFLLILVFAGAYLELEAYFTELVVVVVGMGSVIGLIFIRQILWTYRHYRVPTLLPHVPLKDLPTVSVCIPARNETDALAQCITAALTSDYPKLEVLVLDDCSHDDTSEVIRSFAHRGVRFVKGVSPALGWLGRNNALSTLAKQATSDYLLFVSVDTQLGVDTISKLVGYAKERAGMVSVLPYNRQGFAASTLLTTMQYFWQIALPITNRRVPVSSKCWLIDASVLQRLGGFASVKHKIVPEGSFARRLFGDNAYRFVVSDKALGVTTAKDWVEQTQTSLRLLYPTFKRQPTYVLGALLGLAVLLLPFGLLWFFGGVVFWLCLAAVLLLFAAYALVLLRTHPVTWILSSVFLPVVLVQEAALLVTSMLGYEFSEVNWKGRNVCYPVLHAKRSVRPQGSAATVPRRPSQSAH